jgi:hypothetical protein
MRLVMTLVLRDNIDVVEANIRYHLAQGVDFFLATDHGSRDGTSDVLERYERRGVLRLFRGEHPELMQNLWATRMARLAATEHEADWVINNDADELWFPKEGTLKDVFGRVPDAYGLLISPRTNFAARPDDGRHCFERMTLREVESINAIGERLYPKTAHRASAEIEIGFGCHVARGPGLEPVPFGDPIHVFHYPLRSYAQFARRIENVGSALRGDPDRDVKATPAWRLGYRHLLAGTLGEFYEGHVVGEEAARAGIEEGRLVVDRRVAEFMRADRLLDDDRDTEQASGSEPALASARTAD